MQEVRKHFPAHIPAFMYALCGFASTTATQAPCQIYFIENCHREGTKGPMCVPAVASGTSNVNAKLFDTYFSNLLLNSTCVNS